jgi:DEAD/DEAH box helicase domain-containing protein
MNLSAVLTALRQDSDFMRCVTAWERIPALSARTASWPAGLDPRLVAAAQAQGIEQPYTHQAQAIAAALAGEHVILATSTASGKTLAYNLPVLQALLNDPAACALYLFPPKRWLTTRSQICKSQINKSTSPQSLFTHMTATHPSPIARRFAGMPACW